MGTHTNWIFINFIDYGTDDGTDDVEYEKVHWTILDVSVYLYISL